MKRIIIIIGIIVVIASVFANIYWIGWKQIERKIYQRAVNGVLDTILTQIKNTGQVRIDFEKGFLILVPKQ